MSLPNASERYEADNLQSFPSARTVQSAQPTPESWYSMVSATAAAPSFFCGLHQPHPLQNRMTVLADDDVIMHGNGEFG
jgi:hypothetical protein